MLAGVEYLGISDAGLRIRVHETEQQLAVDQIVLCAGQESLRDLEAGLLAGHRQPHLIGGSAAAGELDARRAIEEGTRLAMTL
jgi:2,4-dienoyl-CoA reductase (NADPH2)